MKRLIPAILLGGAFAVLFPLLLGPWLHERQVVDRYGELIHETTSDYSHIRVRERGQVRSLLFVNGEGGEQRQSAIDLASPDEMVLAYTRAIFATFLFRHPQERVLIVGLGGGGMVRFLNHHFPETQVDVVEIDSKVVEIAAKYFGTMPGPRTAIHTADAFVYLRESHGPYDVIYMDAFLTPPVDSDLGEVTQRLKTAQFLEDIKGQLKPGGLLAFNLIKSHASTANDLAALQGAFPQVYQFSVPKSGNLVVVASQERLRLTKEDILLKAYKLEEALKVGLPWEAFVRNLTL